MIICVIGLPADLPYKGTLAVEDCFELGKIAYSEADYYHTELWMAQALEQLDGGEKSSIDAVTVLDYLSYSIYQQGELERALEHTKRLLMLGKACYKIIQILTNVANCSLIFHPCLTHLVLKKIHSVVHI